MSLEHIPVPAAGNETIDEAINKWLKEIKKLAHKSNPDSIIVENQTTVPEETDKILMPL